MQGQLQVIWTSAPKYFKNWVQMEWNLNKTYPMFLKIRHLLLRSRLESVMQISRL